MKRCSPGVHLDNIGDAEIKLLKIENASDTILYRIYYPNNAHEIREIQPLQLRDVQ